MRIRLHACRRLTIFLVALLVGAPAAADAPRFEITFDADLRGEAFTGRVFIMTTTAQSREPRYGANWFRPEPFFALDVTGWKPGQALRVDPLRCDGFPEPMDKLPAGPRRVQAVISVNDWSHDAINAPGNLYSEPALFTHDPDNPPTVRLTISKRVAEPAMRDTDTVKYVSLRSELLSKFYGRDVFLRAGVLLPDAYAEDADRRFPTLYVIPGFGGSLHDLVRMLHFNIFAPTGLQIVRVALDADCPTGHHVFADSANNGPWGTALVTELIPYLEKQFRLIPESDARYPFGLSSGGWSSLWLQVAYPDTFGGVWSLAPDPVDFSAFQRTNIYDPHDNLYREPDGSPRPVSRPTPRGQIFFEPMSRMEETIGRGGQLQSFEAVFSPRGRDGKPRQLWDRATGSIHEDVAQAWKKYDIRLKIEREWNTLQAKLAGKLHIFCGDQDTFWLDLAVVKLRDALTELGSDAEVVIVPGAHHGLNMQVYQQVAREVAAHFRERYPNWDEGDEAERANQRRAPAASTPPP
ncbi:MAG: hypothetical protein D6744_17910 [Planctomycetota bacterium]|nr:MAG: hypothetical protein D6744_17910 [Planctomycetota bacterium]